ncbi:MAG TPA: FAD-dependent oxidoreductase [Candidatus Sulfopaludibacter sp.]|nr:FAD-dependent oxidoreductase [Candidatus Sulfopaludibacter sp.]
MLFVEEPIFCAELTQPEWQFSEAEPNVLVCTPRTPSRAPGFHDEQMPFLRELLLDLCKREEIENPILWFYTPMALPLADGLAARAIIYDCMDELSAFLNPPPQILEREQALLDRASLVFTGGPSLYQAKQHRHANVYCFPSSVDAAHFAKASGDEIAEAEDQKDLPRPRLGYFGVIDERLDLELLRALADAHPEWQIVMVGPVVKIDPATLPRNSNITYFGQRGYQELPSYLKGWNVCLMPFARNDATRYISPTKTLEYMAAEKMIVSTPITDVAQPYGDVVYLGGTTEEFVSACERALHAPADERTARTTAMREILSRTSWDQTAQRIEALIEETLQAPKRFAKPTRVHALVAGAGPTGLSAAYHLGERAVLLEQNSSVGGWCRSIEKNGFTFDYAGHIMFSNDPYVHELYAMLLGDNVHWQDREAWIYSKNVYTRYPFQGSLYGLPADVIKECIVGAIESRYGALKQPTVTEPAKQPTNGHANGHTNGHTNGHANGNGNGACKLELKDCCADGILEAAAPLVAKPGAGEPRNFEEFIYKVWGAGIARHFAIPYNRKLWAVPLNEMETSWLDGRVPMPDLEEMIEGALSPSPKPMGPNARFGYPLRGGFQALMDGWMPKLKGDVLLNHRVASISPTQHIARLQDGTEMQYDYFISTMPLPVLIRQMGDQAPAEIQAAAKSLRHVSVRCVHIGVGRENLTDKHWIYYPEDTVFHRIFVQGNASPYCNPKGGFGLTCEITYSPQKPLPAEGDELIQRCIEDCHKVGLFRPEDPILVATQCDLPFAYVVYDHGRSKAVRQIRDWLLDHDIILAGRYSEWEYYNSDHAFIAGKKAAEKVQELDAEKTGAYPPADVLSGAVLQSAGD